MCESSGKKKKKCPEVPLFLSKENTSFSFVTWMDFVTSGVPPELYESGFLPHSCPGTVLY